MYICSEVFTASLLIHYSTVTTMIKIFDEQNCLDLNYLAIYLMLTSDENALYGDKLKDLNRYSTLTKGIFHFYIIEKGETPYDKLPEEMIRNMRHYNVMVRLVDSIHDIYCYGLDEIDLEGDKPSILGQLKEFVEQVCKENINHLDVLYYRPTITSRAKSKFLSHQNIVKELFEAALKGEKPYKADVKELLQGDNVSKDIETSLVIAISTIGSSEGIMDPKVERDLYLKIEPKKRPCVKITVKKVKTEKERKDGSAKEKIGVELNIDGNIIPVSFVSTDQTFLYIINLIAIMEGRYIQPSRFLPLENEETKYKESVYAVVLGRRNKLISWLRKRYNALYFKKDFDVWYDVVKNNPHRLHDAITGIRSTLWNKLKEKNCKEAFYYCALRNDDGRYRIRIDRENISIDPKIMERFLATRDEYSED